MQVRVVSPGYPPIGNVDRRGFRTEKRYAGLVRSPEEVPPATGNPPEAVCVILVAPDTPSGRQEEEP